MVKEYVGKVRTKAIQNRIDRFEMRFRKLTMNDRNWVEKACHEDGNIAGHVHMLTMLIYQELYSYDAFMRCHDCVVKLPWVDGEKLICQYPIGSPRNRQAAIQNIIEIYSPKYSSITFIGASKEGLHQVQELYPRNIIGFENDRDSQNYILDIREQINLEGSAFADRRNKIRRFNKLNKWTYEPIDKSNLDICIQLNSEWCDSYGDEIIAERGKIEMELVLKYYNDFNCQGELYRIDGKPVAFSIGCPFNNDIYINQIMKAKKEYRDITTAVLHEFMKRNCAGYTYTNYTEDMGLPGLRKFKTMLHPKFLTDFYIITLNFDR